MDFLTSSLYVRPEYLFCEIGVFLPPFRWIVSFVRSSILFRFFFQHSSSKLCKCWWRGVEAFVAVSAAVSAEVSSTLKFLRHGCGLNHVPVFVVTEAVLKYEHVGMAQACPAFGVGERRSLDWNSFQHTDICVLCVRWGPTFDHYWNMVRRHRALAKWYVREKELFLGRASQTVSTGKCTGKTKVLHRVSPLFMNKEIVSMNTALILSLGGRRCLLWPPPTCLNDIFLEIRTSCIAYQQTIFSFPLCLMLTSSHILNTLETPLSATIEFAIVLREVAQVENR